MSTKDSGVLIKLVDSGQTVANPVEDIRGRVVIDSNGDEIGTIRHLLIDEREQRVRMLRLEHGGILGFGASASFLPVEAIERVTESTVYLTRSGKHIAGAPAYDPQLRETDPALLYVYYGFLPFWAPGSAFLPWGPEPTRDEARPPGNPRPDHDQR